MKIGGDVPPFFGVNAALAACLYLVDVGLNSSIEYGDLPGQDVLDNSSDSIVSFGLFGMLYSHFRLVLLVHPLYICLTIILGIVRMNLLSLGNAHADIWDVQGYAALSGIHKIGALCYYACSIYAVEKLRNRKYYSPEYWMRK
ncbi:hypothetical protein AM587_10005846 [Phytophthora nicotianae]|uniref:Uncharacterized protein n=1 Tax=Phytophthora nicotianae TaxID=4792 RepID=A0A0W8C4B4_PHYNI|nr:hypothetical protein AM587_10005846 [Phytophthora nicotianae]